MVCGTSHEADDLLMLYERSLNLKILFSKLRKSPPFRPAGHIFDENFSIAFAKSIQDTPSMHNWPNSRFELVFANEDDR